jgi:hypothetical protein
MAAMAENRPAVWALGRKLSRPQWKIVAYLSHHATPMLDSTWLAEVGPPERLAADLNLDLHQLEQSISALKAKKGVEPLPENPRAYRIVAAAASLASSPD